jgi:hypothetical protein
MKIETNLPDWFHSCSRNNGEEYRTINLTTVAAKLRVPTRLPPSVARASRRDHVQPSRAARNNFSVTIRARTIERFTNAEPLI